MVDLSLKFYTVSTMLIHKDEGSDSSVTNCMSRFSIFVTAKVTVKLANGNTVHANELVLSYFVLLTLTLYIR